IRARGSRAMATFQNRDGCLNQRDGSPDNRDECLDSRDSCLNNGARREHVPTGPRVGHVRGGVLMLIALLCATAFGAGVTAQTTFKDIADYNWTCNGWGTPGDPLPA